MLMAGGQVRVNEFLAANTRAHPDVVDFDDYPDWIEIKNTSDEEVELGGYFLSDDPAKPFKWAFPASAKIGGGGYLVIWADGHDAVPGELRPRGYWPWRSFAVEGHHTNFSLSAEGESVVLTRAEGLAAVPLVNAASPPPEVPAAVAQWKYLADGSDAGTRWRDRDYDDSQWPEGAAKLGYGDSGMATVVPYGSSALKKHITTYFRKSFEVEDPGKLASLSLKLLVDDGAVVYLNGEEVVRQNLPSGAIAHTTLASSAVGGSAETRFTDYKIPVARLVAGENLIAVEVHQSAADSSDMSFDLALAAVAFTSTTTMDHVEYGTQVDDISYGRDSSDDSQWVSFAEPTPGAANGGGKISDLRSVGGAVVVSLESGFYPSPQRVELSTGSGEIRYTLDGSLPRSSSSLYESPLEISETTVLRARAFGASKPAGAVETRTYFFGENPGDVPYLSLVADPELLFGDRLGIYYNQHEPLVSSSSNAALGLRDVYKGKDAPGSLEFFEPEGGGGFRVNGGIRIGGENNWVHGQRAMNFSVRGKYGDDIISYDLFPGSRVGNHKSLTLRDGGDAWAKEMLRDGMWPSIAAGRMKVDTSSYRPSVVFINGDYWGIHNIRSRWDDTWFFEHKRASPGGVDHLQYGHVVSSSTSLGVEKGDAIDWLELLKFAANNDLTRSENYQFVEARVDIDSYIDFIVAESYGINVSWRHNREFWRERKPGSKWRWFLPDMDQTFRESQLAVSVLGEMLAREELLIRLKVNADFRGRLVQRFAAHVGSTFKPARIHDLIDRMAAEVEGEVGRHVERWASFGGMSQSGRISNISGVKRFTLTRDANVHSEIQARVGLPAPVEVTFGVEGNDGGRILVAGVPVEPGVVRLFPAIGFSLQAESEPGFRFDGWVGITGDASTVVTVDSPLAITARFVPSGETLLGGLLEEDMTLDSAGSPYALRDDLIVAAGVTLTMGPGVEIRMPAGRNLRVMGSMVVNGTDLEPVRVEGRDGATWGGISFENPSGPSRLSHLTLRGASKGFDAILYPYAISGLHAVLVLEHLDIDECEGPVFTRGGSVILRWSRLRTPYTGDCINVKGGNAEVRNCVFMGNNAPDTDAIDYDGVVGGMIADNRIYRFRGPNSDAIDIGEQCSGVSIEGNLIYYCSDKAISVGQGSSAFIRRNLVVGCELGVGVKDYESFAVIDQNTFVNCAGGVEVYEKNFGNGGGSALVENSIFSRCADRAVVMDLQSSALVNYSLSDTIALAGEGNLLADPGFVDRAVLNFELMPGSPAVDAGRPGHSFDPDGTRLDMGARYAYLPGDYPFVIGQPVVIEELLANSDGASDWVELHNRSSGSVDISGWFLSDSKSNFMKYRIPDGTVLPAGGHIVFDADIHFGEGSIDPGRIIPFGISDRGETLYLSSAVNNELTDYQTKEEFGASLLGESLGNYYKPSSDSWNFVAMRMPTPGGPNGNPRVGPVVITEIMYQPAGHADSEYFELTNISGEDVSLYDSEKGAAWRISDGITFEFPSVDPVVLAPGQRVILTRSLSRFYEAFEAAPGTRVLEWTSGRLANEGERLQLARPAGLDGENVRMFARVDRVTYRPDWPWPAAAAGSGMALSRVVEDEYGNDFANWAAGVASPGTGESVMTYAGWAEGYWVAGDDPGPEADPDGDGRSNLLEFALGTSPVDFDVAPAFTLALERGTVNFALAGRANVRVWLEYSETLGEGSWEPLEAQPLEPLGIADGQQFWEVVLPVARERGFLRMAVAPVTP